MRTQFDLADYDDEFDTDDEFEVTRSDLMGYFHPREILGDVTLSAQRKRVLLAHWASDYNAVRGAPALRRSPAGVTATIDEIKDALSQVENLPDAAILPRNNNLQVGA